MFREGLEQQWADLKAVLLRLPPWFRLSQFLLSLGAEENLKKVMAQARCRRDRNGYKDSGAARPDVVESFSLLWHEVLDPVDRALLEEHAGLNGPEGEVIVTGV